MLRPCPACALVVPETAPARVMLVITTDGLLHALPAVWVADRRADFERDGLMPVEALRAAYLEWATTCAAGRES